MIQDRPEGLQTRPGAAALQQGADGDGGERCCERQAPRQGPRRSRQQAGREGEQRHFQERRAQKPRHSHAGIDGGLQAGMRPQKKVRADQACIGAVDEHVQAIVAWPQMIVRNGPRGCRRTKGLRRRRLC